MFTGEQLAAMISDVFFLHQAQARTPEKAFRRFDGVTPYGVHPTLAATIFLHEESLPEDFRMCGCKALLAHDLFEDTNITGFPRWCDNQVTRNLVSELTFIEGEDPSVEIWNRSDQAKLLKFYDVVINLMCVGKMAPERIQYRYEQAKIHLAWVHEHYPKLEIVKIAKGLLEV